MEPPSHELSDEMERREQPPAVTPQLITRSARSAVGPQLLPLRSAPSDFQSPPIDDTPKKRPNASSLTYWLIFERSTCDDPQEAIEKLWRKREKRLRRAQMKSNKDAPVNLAED